MSWTSRRGLRLTVPLAIASGVGALALTGVAFAGDSASDVPAPNHLTIVAKGKGHPLLHYKVRGGVSAIRHGGTLSIVNRTKEPHTFSLITKKVRPTTRKAQRQCYNKHHICRKIFEWHGASGNSPPTKNPVDVGKKGWDREGNLHRKGDSVVYNPGENPKPAKVSAGNETTLYFLCALHPWMHGKIHVED